MKSYPLNSGVFADTSVTSSFAISSSFIVGLVPTASHTLFPVGPQGTAGTSGGKVYLLSSSLLVCLGSTTTTTTTTSTTTSTTTTTTTTAAPITTTTTTTAAPICGGPCGPGIARCPEGCQCVQVSGELYKCQQAIS